MDKSLLEVLPISIISRGTPIISLTSEISALVSETKESMASMVL